MCANVILMEVVVAERLAAARAAAADERLLQSLRAARAPLRAILGAHLVEIGERLLGSPRDGRRHPGPARRTAEPST